MSTDPQEALQIAKAWDELSKAHDLEGFSQLLSDDFEMRYNFDPSPRSKSQLLTSLGEIYANFEDHSHEDAHVIPTAEGFVIQARLSGKLAGGAVNAHFCLVATVRDGKVYRAWEYFDTAQLPARVGAPGEAMH